MQYNTCLQRDILFSVCVCRSTVVRVAVVIDVRLLMPAVTAAIDNLRGDPIDDAVKRLPVPGGSYNCLKQDLKCNYIQMIIQFFNDMKKVDSF